MPILLGILGTARESELESKLEAEREAEAEAEAETEERGERVVGRAAGIELDGSSPGNRLLFLFLSFSLMPLPR